MRTPTLSDPKTKTWFYMAEILQFVKHLATKTIKNPFPGLPALEALIGRKIVARIGSNEGIALEKHPLKGGDRW